MIFAGAFVAIYNVQALANFRLGGLGIRWPSPQTIISECKVDSVHCCREVIFKRWWDVMYPRTSNTVITSWEAWVIEHTDGTISGKFCCLDTRDFPLPPSELRSVGPYRMRCDAPKVIKFDMLPFVRFYEPNALYDPEIRHTTRLIPTMIKCEDVNVDTILRIEVKTLGNVDIPTEQGIKTLQGVNFICYDSIERDGEVFQTRRLAPVSQYMPMLPRRPLGPPGKQL